MCTANFPPGLECASSRVGIAQHGNRLAAIAQNRAHNGSLITIVIDRYQDIQNKMRCYHTFTLTFRHIHPQLQIYRINVNPDV